MLLSACAANALVFLDQTAATVALPAIGGELGASGAELSLVIGSYLIALAALMPAAGRLAEHWGRRRAFLAGIGVFGLASLGCAAAPSIEVLIAVRVLQGAGAAVAVPLALAGVTAAMPPERRGWAVGAFATGGTLFLGLGPLLGALALEAGSWRWVFALNVPVVAFALALGARGERDGRAANPPSLDLPGLLSLSGGLAMLVWGALQASSAGASPVELLVAAGGAALLACFAAHERRAAEPLLDLALLRDRSLAAYLFALFAIQLAVLGTTVQLMLFLQDVRGYAPIVAALLFLPTVLGTPLFSARTGRLADAHGSRSLVLRGLVLAAAALLWIALAAGAGGAIGLLLVGFALFGAARPLVFTPASSAALGALGPARRNLAAALAMTARQLGAVCGVALAGILAASATDPTTGFEAALLALSALCLATAFTTRALLGRDDPKNPKANPISGGGAHPVTMSERCGTSPRRERSPRA
ncbi:MAG TPA: MFS transporter [Solirubrobacterales bacterium]|nr:MFS transporter [Solirubrobacterales bacterium]